MSYQSYMNMGFGAGGGVHPYMMGFPGGMAVQMTDQRQQLVNERPSDMVSVPSRPQPPRSGKRKMNSDPNRPKRPTSAYFFFIQIEREEAAKRGEKITRVAQWTKQISVKWRELTVEEKEQFQRMAANDKARYTEQMAVYTGKDANRPKRPQSSYFLWLADFRSHMKGKFIVNKDILRAAGEEWRQLTIMAKAPYEQRAEEERRKYEQAMKEYNMSGGAKKACPAPALDKVNPSSNTASRYLPSSQPQQQTHSMQQDEKQLRQQDCDDNNTGDDDDDDDDEGDFDDEGYE